MAARNEAKIRFSAETKEFDSGIKSANGTLARLRSELKLNEAQMKVNGTSVDGLRAKQQNLTAQMEAAQDKTKALSDKLAVAVSVFGENSAEANKLRGQLQTAQIAETKLQDAINKCNAELERQEQAAKNAESASGKLTDEIGDQQKELDELKRAYVNAVLEFGEGSDEANELAGKIGVLSGELKENKKRMTDAEKAADELDESLEDAGESAEDAADGGFTVLKGAMADLVADGIAGVIDGMTEITKSAFGMANDIGKATNSFIAKTGESTENAEQFEDVMKNIYNGNYGESFEDIAESMAIVKTSMGDIGTEELENLTTQALILRDTFDMDVNESIRAVNSMMDQFGITADEAYSLIAQGAQNGLNQNGDLLDVINEYSVQFSNAGYSADDMFNMLANGVEAGTWSVDKLGDALKEMNIRLSDGTADEALKKLGLGFEEAAVDAEKLKKAELNVSNAQLKVAEAQKKATEALRKHGQNSVEYQKAVNDVTAAELALTDAQSAFNEEAGKTEYNLDSIKEKLAAGGESGQEAMNQIMAALMSVEDEQERYILGQSIMGTMWEDLGEDAMAALMDTRGGITSTTDALEKINSVKYDDLGSALEGIKRNLETSVAEPIKENVMPAVNEFVQDVDWQGVGETIGETFGTVVENALALVSAIGEAVKWMNENKAVAITLAAGIGVIATALELLTVAKAVKIAMDKAEVSSIGALIAAHWSQAAAGMAALAPYILVVAAIAAVIAIIVLCIKYWDDIVAAVKRVWASIVSFLEPVTSWINDYVIQPIVDYFKGAWENIEVIWSIAVDYFRMIWENIKAVFSVVKEIFVAYFKAGWEGIKLVWSVVVAYFQMVWNNIKAIFSVVKSVLTGDFKGAWEGIKGIWSNVRGFFDSVISSVKTAFSNVTSIISKPFQAAKDAVGKVVDNIKGFFSNLKLSLPKIKLPHFKITGTLSLNPPSVPKLSIEWYKDGGIMMNPTIFGMNGNSLMAGGEAGPEAILPIDRLQGYITSAIDKTMQRNDLQSLVNAVEDLASRAIELNINGRQFAVATAADTDSVSGNRYALTKRGLAL